MKITKEWLEEKEACSENEIFKIWNKIIKFDVICKNCKHFYICNSLKATKCDKFIKTEQEILKYYCEKSKVLDMVEVNLEELKKLLIREVYEEPSDFDIDNIIDFIQNNQSKLLKLKETKI